MSTAYTIPVYRQPTVSPRSTSSTTPSAPAQTCSCTKTVALTVQRGATLATKVTLTITDSTVTPPLVSPVDVTGCWFQFTAKPDQATPDDDPSTVALDWQETDTPTQGITWLKLDASVTYDMQPIAYIMQVRMVSADLTGVVTPLIGGTLTITEPPASARYEPIGT